MWNILTKSVTDKASCATDFLTYAKHFLSEAVVKIFYNRIIEPRIRFCCSLWDCCNSSDILGLQGLQNRAARILTNSHFAAPSKPQIQSLGWKAIEHLLNREVNLTVFKCLSRIAPKYLSGIFTENAFAAPSLRNTNTDFF